jgi:NTE family protein
MARSRKRVNLAIQGGGSHGAYAWGILDRFLEDGRIEIEGISGTSAGSMNAVMYAYGYMVGGADGARERLAAFWKGLSRTGMGQGSEYSVQAFKMLTGSSSPYQWNPWNLNPLRDVLEANVDFEELRRCKTTKLFLAATNVRSGRGRVFTNPEITVDAVLASSCLPHLFHAVEIDGEPYWDGGYIGNPVLYPLFYETRSRDVIILHINPISRPGTPRSAHEIDDRLDEISFNSSLIKELRAIAFVQKLIEDGWLKERYRSQLKNVLIHSIRADKALSDLSVASKLALDWPFLNNLFERGREAGGLWLDVHYADLGRRQSVDLRTEFL